MEESPLKLDLGGGKDFLVKQYNYLFLKEMASVIVQIILFFLNVLTREGLKRIWTLIWISNSHCFIFRTLILNSLLILFSNFLGPIKKCVYSF